MTQSGDNPATITQRMPGGYGVPVLELVVSDLKERSEVGEKKYGRPLHTDNGRRPLVDAYQEVLDLAMYLRQELEERDDNATLLGTLAAIRAENARLLAEADGYRDEIRLANMKLDKVHAAIRALEAEPQPETSRSIATWQAETFGPATTTPERILRSGMAMQKALLTAALLNFSMIRPNLSRAIRAVEELAELVTVLCNDDADPRASEEATDVDIVLSGILAYHGKELTEERSRKMAINRRRKWATTGDGHGQHVLSQHEEDGSK